MSVEIGCGVLPHAGLAGMLFAAVQADEPLLGVPQVLTSTYEKGLFHFWDKNSWCVQPLCCY